MISRRPPPQDPTPKSVSRGRLAPAHQRIPHPAHVHPLRLFLAPRRPVDRGEGPLRRRIRSLTTIESVHNGFIGTPASTDREIIDRSYSYALVVAFTDEAAHEAYQVHPVHDRFREQCGGSWKKIVIYDAVSA